MTPGEARTALHFFYPCRKQDDGACTVCDYLDAALAAERAACLACKPHMTGTPQTAVGGGYVAGWEAACRLWEQAIRERTPGRNVTEGGPDGAE